VKFIVGIFSVLLFYSCNIFELKSLDVKEIEKNGIQVRWFYTSDISTVHNHVEIKDKNGWNQIMETDGNGYKIYDVLIINDSIIVQGYKDMTVYDIKTHYANTYIKFDSAVTLYNYMKKFRPAEAKYYKNTE